MGTKKLELKHLAVYLPYELKGVFYIKNKNKYVIGSKEYRILDSSIVAVLFDLDSNFGFKPILRPLSDLNQEIIDEIKKETYCSENDINILEIIIILKTIPYPLKSRNKSVSKYISYGVFVELCEMHFDVFGLIDAGLAIDINTLSHD